MPDDIRPDYRFSIVPEWVLFDAGLEPGPIRLYATLGRYVDVSMKAFPSRRTLARMCDVKTPKTIDRWMDKLVEAGAVTKIARTNDAGDPTSNLYVLRRLPPGVVYDMGTQASIDRDTDDTIGRNTDDTIGNPTDVPLTIPTGNDNHPETEAAVRWARRWCEIMGQAQTRTVLARYAPQILEFIRTTGKEPTEDLLQMARTQGINTPGGWAFVRGAVEAQPDNPEAEHEIEAIANCGMCSDSGWIDHPNGSGMVRCAHKEGD